MGLCRSEGSWYLPERLWHSSCACLGGTCQDASCEYFLILFFVGGGGGVVSGCQTKRRASVSCALPAVTICHNCMAVDTTGLTRLRRDAAGSRHLTMQSHAEASDPASTSLATSSVLVSFMSRSCHVQSRGVSSRHESKMDRQEQLLSGLGAGSAVWAITVASLTASGRSTSKCVRCGLALREDARNVCNRRCNYGRCKSLQ